MSAAEPDVSNLLTVAEATKIIDAAAVAPRVIEVPLHEADGLVLAADVRADRDYPPFDKSLMDGYAVRTADAARAGAELSVVGEVAAGAASARVLAAGEAVAIMTGAPLPAGADGVVPVEDVEKRSAATVRVVRAVAPAPGRFIARRGSDARAGDLVLVRGTPIGPAQLAALATVGAARVAAFAKPRAAVLSTGNEIVPYDQVPSGPEIRNSNAIMLVALLKRLGCDVTDLGSVRDERDAVRDALRNGFGFDLLFVTGGMSMGAYDYVPRTLVELGADLRITKLRIKPGKPFVFGVVKDEEGQREKGTQGQREAEDRPGASKLAPASASPSVPQSLIPSVPARSTFLFGLPGNPVSAFVCTVRLAARLVARLRGEAAAGEKWVHASLAEPLPANGPREFYQPVVCRDGVATPLKWKGSADVFRLAAANGLLARAENQPALPAGASVRVLEV